MILHSPTACIAFTLSYYGSFTTYVQDFFVLYLYWMIKTGPDDERGINARREREQRRRRPCAQHRARLQPRRPHFGKGGQEHRPEDTPQDDLVPDPVHGRAFGEEGAAHVIPRPAPEPA